MTDETEPKKAAPKKRAARKAPAKKATAKKAAPKTAAAKKKEAEAKDLAAEAERKALQIELQAILDELADKKRSIAELAGEQRARIKAILSEHDWHKTALSDIRKIDAMSETARADFLRTFVPLFEAMYQGVWKGEMRDMLADLDEEAKEKMADAVPAGNVVKMPGAKTATQPRKAGEADLSGIDKELGRK